MAPFYAARSAPVKPPAQLFSDAAQYQPEGHREEAGGDQRHDPSMAGAVGRWAMMLA